MVLSLCMVFIIANSTDPNELMHLMEGYSECRDAYPKCLLSGLCKTFFRNLGTFLGMSDFHRYLRIFHEFEDGEYSSPGSLFGITGLAEP